MADRIRTNIVIRWVHILSSFIVLGFLLMYIISGFLIPRHKLLPALETKSDTIEYSLSLPAGLQDEKLSVFLQKEFNLRGHRGIPERKDNGEISIFYYRPGMEYVAEIAADQKSVKIITHPTSIRSVIVIFHRMRGYGGGLPYDLYILMTDLTGIALILFSVTGIYLGLYNGRQILLKLLLLFLGVGYTSLVIFTFLHL